MTLQADESLGTDSSEQLPDDDLNTDIDTDEAENDPADDGEVEVTFGEPSDDEAQDDDDGETPVIRAMRKREREKDKELRKAKRELELLRQQQQPANAAPELPPKPTLESCGWDETEFEQRLDDWKERSKAAESVKAEQERVAQMDFDKYQAQIKALNVKDYPKYEAEVADVFDQTRQSILWDAAENKALLIYALATNPDQLERLSKITSLAKFAAELGKLEKDLKVSKPTKPAPADTNLRSNAPASGSSKKLAQLEADAERTGDRTKLIAYKKSLRK